MHETEKFYENADLQTVVNLNMTVMQWNNVQYVTSL